MFSKLAFKNVTRSIRDYTVYFLTLTFGVCIFYVFNSLETQQVMLEMSQEQHAMMDVIIQMIGIISVFVSAVLAFLILYANKFMMKRRKRELGIYMTLGMKKGKISGLLLLETFIIGVGALVVGLLLGVFASQGLAVITAKIFEVRIRNFQFVFSQSAFYKTILYFGIIYLLVMLFNSYSVSRCKLIDLINAQKKNEELKTKKLWVSVVIFILAIACLGFAYYCIIQNGMYSIDLQFWSAIVFGTIGTLLFFMSLSGFLLRIVKSNKRLYYKNLNMFVLRQLNSKINTTYVSMTVICIMLLLSIGIFSCAAGMNNALQSNIDSAVAFDISYITYGDLGKYESLEQAIQEKAGDPQEYLKDTYEFSIRRTGLQFKEMMGDYTRMLGSNENIQWFDFALASVSLSDYNKVMALQGKDTIALRDDEFAVIANIQNYVSMLEEYQKGDNRIEIGSYRLMMSPTLPVLQTPMDNMFSNAQSMVLILPNEVFASLEENSAHVLVGNYKNSGMGYEEKVVEFNEPLQNVYDEEDIFVDYTTRTSLYEGQMGMKALVIFVGLYLGVIFLLASAAVLALQQLSEATDNIYRYKLLRQLGVEEKMLNRSIFTQIALYFFVPLLLAIVHSVVGMYVANGVMTTFGKVDAVASTAFTAVLMIIIYGGYFVLTYLCCRNILKYKKNS